MGPPKATSCTLLKNMKVISAYMLAVVGGNTSPTKEQIAKILSSVGISMDAEAEKEFDSFVAQVGESSYEELLKNGLEEIKKCPGGGAGGAPVAAAAGAAGAAGGDAPAAAEEEEEEEEEEMATGGGLFGDDGDDY